MSTLDSTPWDPEVACAIIDELKHKPGALLPILHALQERFAHIPDAAVALIAPALKLSRARSPRRDQLLPPFSYAAARPPCAGDLPC